MSYYHDIIIDIYESMKFVDWDEDKGDSGWETLREIRAILFPPPQENDH